MTPSQQRALNTLQRLADRLEPRVRYAYRSALQRLRLGGDLSRVERALERGDIEGAVTALLPPDATLQLSHALTVAVAQVVAQAGPDAAKAIASTIRLDFSFVAGSPQSAAAMQRMDLSAVVPVARDAEQGLRTVLTQGVFDGVNPRIVAREARDFVGLTTYDGKLVDSFDAQLRLDPARVLSRELRDKRFDASIVKAMNGQPLTETQIVAMRDRYVSALHDWRAETWARTTTLKAVRETQHAAWLQAADDLGIGNDRLVKTWITTLDGRERPTHHALHGDTVPIDQPFSNGDMVPGDGTGIEGEEFNCRCVEVIRVLSADGPTASQFLAERAQRFADERAAVA